MHSVPKISVWQLFAVLLLSRLLTLLTYTTLGAEAMQNADYFPSAVFSVSSRSTEVSNILALWSELFIE